MDKYSTRMKLIIGLVVLPLSPVLLLALPPILLVLVCSSPLLIPAVSAWAALRYLKGKAPNSGAIAAATEGKGGLTSDTDSVQADSSQSADIRTAKDPETQAVGDEIVPEGTSASTPLLLLPLQQEAMAPIRPHELLAMDFGTLATDEHPPKTTETSVKAEGFAGDDTSSNAPPANTSEAAPVDKSDEAEVVDDEGPIQVPAGEPLISEASKPGEEPPKSSQGPQVVEHESQSAALAEQFEPLLPAAPTDKEVVPESNKGQV